MLKATAADQELVIDIISKTFPTNPSVMSVLKNDDKIEQRMRWLARFVFRTALRRNGIYISSDRQGVAICYRYNQKKDSLIDYWDQLILAFTAIGIERIHKVLRRDAYVKSKRPKSGDFLYFWFFGVNEEARGKTASYELKDAVFNLSKEQNLPIYIETSIQKNKNVYERYGFETYHTWDYKSENITLWFMRSKTSP